MKSLQQQIDALSVARASAEGDAEREQNGKVREIIRDRAEALADAAESLKRLESVIEFFGKLWRTK